MDITLQKKLRGGRESFQLDVNFHADPGSLLGIMGPSGAGKTSILKMIAGLFTPDQGSVRISGETWFDKNRKINLRPQLRSIGYVFQEYALFPNMSVRDNLQYALPVKQSATVIDEVLDLMHIRNLQHQKPNALSGGQQQRVALARAIVRQPQVLLLDEPFAALDSQMRAKLQDDLLKIHRHFQTTTLLVSHNQEEVIRMADKVLILNEGQISQAGSPSQVLAESFPEPMVGKILSINGNTVKIVSEQSLDFRTILNASSHFQVGDTVYLSPTHQSLTKVEKA